MPNPMVCFPRTVVNESANSQLGLSDPVYALTDPPALLGPVNPPVPKVIFGHDCCRAVKVVNVPVKPSALTTAGEGSRTFPSGACARSLPKRKLFTFVGPRLMV